MHQGVECQLPTLKPVANATFKRGQMVSGFCVKCITGPKPQSFQDPSYHEIDLWDFPLFA